MASDFNFTLDEYIQKKNMAEKTKRKANTFDDIDAELDLMITDDDVDLDLDLGEDELEINASSVTVNTSSSNNSQVAENSFDLRHHLDGLMVEPEPSRTPQNNNKKKNKNRRSGNNSWYWRNRNSQQKSNFNNSPNNQRNGQNNNRNGNFRPKPNNCQQFRAGQHSSPKLMISGPLQMTQKARCVLENPAPGGQTAIATGNGSMKSLLGINEAISNEMMPVLAAKFLELIKGNGMQQTVHKPIYDMKIQQDIHRLQKKSLTYKCPGGEVVSSDGAGIQNCIIKPNASGISMNYRFG